MLINDIEKKFDEHDVSIIDLLNRINKHDQSYFTASGGIVISDNRQFGMDTIDISIDPTLMMANPRIDVLESEIIELKKMNKLMLEYISESNNKQKK